MRKHITGQVAVGHVYDLPWSLQVRLLTGLLPSATLEGRFSTPAPLLLLVELPDALLLSGQAHIKFLALDVHPSPIAPDHNVSPSSILLGHQCYRTPSRQTQSTFSTTLATSYFSSRTSTSNCATTMTNQTSLWTSSMVMTSPREQTSKAAARGRAAS
jgi:hypothetical protein